MQISSRKRQVSAVEASCWYAQVEWEQDRDEKDGKLERKTHTHTSLSRFWSNQLQCKFQTKSAKWAVAILRLISASAWHPIHLPSEETTKHASTISLLEPYDDDSPANQSVQTLTQSQTLVSSEVRLPCPKMPGLSSWNLCKIRIRIKYSPVPKQFSNVRSEHLYWASKIVVCYISQSYVRQTIPLGFSLFLF